MKGYAKLSAADRVVLESYKSVLDGLSLYMGPGYEMVLHNLEDIDRSAIKVINGHYTGRSEGAPITDLGLDLLQRIKRSGDNHKSLVYFNRGKRGAPIRSATIPITGENDQLIALLCINFYMDQPLNAFLDALTRVDETNDVEETFASSTHELILATLEGAKAKVMGDPRIPATNRNKEIVAILVHKDIFKLKDAVAIVAEHLGISRNTVYMHIRNRGNG